MAMVLYFAVVGHVPLVTVAYTFEYSSSQMDIVPEGLAHLS